MILNRTTKLCGKTQKRRRNQLAQLLTTEYVGHHEHKYDHTRTPVKALTNSHNAIIKIEKNLVLQKKSTSDGRVNKNNWIQVL